MNNLIINMIKLFTPADSGGSVVPYRSAPAD